MEVKYDGPGPHTTGARARQGHPRGKEKAAHEGRPEFRMFC